MYLCRLGYPTYILRISYVYLTCILRVWYVSVCYQIVIRYSFFFGRIVGCVLDFEGVLFLMYSIVFWSVLSLDCSVFFRVYFL